MLAYYTETARAQNSGRSFEKVVRISTDLKLNSIDTATFSFHIIFSFATLVQLFATYRLFKPNHSESIVPHQRLFRWMMIFLIACLLSSYALATVNLVHDRYKGSIKNAPSFFAKPLKPAMYDMERFIRDLSDNLIYLILLVFIRYRCQMLSLPSRDYIHSPRMSPLHWIVPVLLLCATSIASLTSLLLLFVLDRNPKIDLGIFGVLQASEDLKLGFSVLLTISFVFACSALWRNVKSDSESSPQCRCFDQQVLKPIRGALCALLVIRALYRLSTYIVISVVASYKRDVFELVDIVMTGIMYFSIIHVMSGLGHIWEGELGKENKTEERDIPLEHLP